MLVGCRLRPIAVSTVFLSYLLWAELGLVERSVWSKVRGPQMVMCMKIISFAFDAESGTGRKLRGWEFLGYALCPGTIVFGPWSPFAEYLASFENDQWDLRWLRRILSSFLKSVVFFATSVCLLEWTIPDDSSTYWLVYRDAALFRAGHYFVSFASETSALLAGARETLEVSRPSAIELPHSLVQVVVHWNLPIHRWLKTYVFKTTLPAGTFVAVMSTYLVSALLHGANVQLSAVLLSLGLYTFVEHSLRGKLSRVLGACVAARPCSRPCSRHRRHSTDNLLVHTVNSAFTLLAIFHLAYLGCIIDNTGGSGSPQPPLHRWAELSYLSHFLVLATYSLHLLLSLLTAH